MGDPQEELSDHWQAGLEPRHEKTRLQGVRQCRTQTIEPQKMARGLKFHIYEGERLYYLILYMQNTGFPMRRLTWLFSHVH